MSFAVVTFTSTQEVAVVPVNWIKCNNCLWPPKNLSSRVLSQVDKGITASDAWESYSVQIMGIFGN